MFRYFVVKIYITIFAGISYIPLFLLSKFINKNNRSYFWRITAIPMIKLSLFLSGINIKKINEKENKHSNLIYTSNHPSGFDGFVLQSVLGANVVPITAPLRQFPFLINLWLRNMGAIDIVRDEIDEAKYGESNNKNRALHKALAILKKGNSIMIFPEGHTELIEALYKFHTGAARLSLASGIPIQTIILEDAHRVFSDSLSNTGKRVTVRFGECLDVKEIFGEEILFSKNEKERDAVKLVTKNIEKEILKKLPVRLISEQRKYSSNTIVFVDIDLTIYKSLSQIDFVKDLVKKGFIPKKEGAKIIYLFILEKLKIISHDDLMKEAIKFISGWNVNTVNHLVQRFFRELALPKLEYGLFILLEDHLAKGHHIVFVTEVIHPLAQTFVDFFGADKAIDTSLIQRGFTYTGDINLLCEGEEKKKGVEKFIKENQIDASRCYAYADSYKDIPFLSIVGHPVVVHPDYKLKKYAKKHNFSILKPHI